MSITLAEELRQEEAALSRRFIYHTRPRRPLTLVEAMCLSERMAQATPEEDIRGPQGI